MGFGFVLESIQFFIYSKNDYLLNWVTPNINSNLNSNPNLNETTFFFNVFLGYCLGLMGGFQTILKGVLVLWGLLCTTLCFLFRTRREILRGTSRFLMTLCRVLCKLCCNIRSTSVLLSVLTFWFLCNRMCGVETTRLYLMTRRKLFVKTALESSNVIILPPSNVGIDIGIGSETTTVPVGETGITIDFFLDHSHTIVMDTINFDSIYNVPNYILFSLFSLFEFFTFYVIIFFCLTYCKNLYIKYFT
jgi:hypothetical protein